ncbi:MAG TPA: hypothetical protein VNZ26_11300 [Vicinamibacterales bacterium]|jgi:hypothetical protein|nr:hypothetical protein [Vicinamibacterales bacterium]
MKKHDILPNCIAARSERTIVWANGMKWIPIFCANCGTDGGQVLETDWERAKNFAFYLCDPCAEKWSPLAGMALSPDEAFWQKIREAQIENFGRELSNVELVEALKDDEHVLTKLCKDRHDFKKLTSAP